MRSEWVPVSAAALVTGVMALVLGQTLNPSGSETSPAAQMVIAAESPGRWVAMSVLFFLGAAAIVLGIPAILTLFDRTRGGRIGTWGAAVLTVGCVGVGGLSALMLMFQSIALEVLKSRTDHTPATRMVAAAMRDPALLVTLNVWIYGFLVGVLLITIGLFASKRVPRWVPSLLVAFLAVQAALPLFGAGMDARIASSIGLVLLASGFTGIATNAAGVRAERPLTHRWVAGT